MSKTKAEKHAEIHAQAMREFDAIQAAVKDERLQCLQDRRFYSVQGAQWEGPMGEQFEARPRFEFNKVHLAVIRIVNEYRNNRITVDFTPKDGSSNQELADTCNGLYRADEQDSVAQEAYDNAFEEAVGGGFGAWRLRAAYEDEDDDENDKQRVLMEPIYDADSSVFFDLDAKRQDKADARRCFVLTAMTHDAFTEEFGTSPSSWPKLINQTAFDWATPQVVYVAEYYRVEESSSVVHVFRGLDEEDMDVPDAELLADPDKLPMLLATGFREVRQKRIKRRKVRKYLMSGHQVEEDCGYIAGTCIPIIPVYGKRWFVDNIERCMGHVRLAKDAQRLMNSLLSWMTEIVSRFDIEKPIVTPEQINGYATMWAEDNVKRYPYLVLNSFKDLDGNPIPGTGQPMAYTKAPNIPPAMAALIQIAGQALEDLLGNQQAGEQLQPNQSGKAVELIQTRLDMQVFIYMSNFGKAAKRSGEVWLSMMRDIAIEDGRQMKMVTSDGTVDTTVINTEEYDAETGEVKPTNAIADARFDVFADVGPSSSSKRAATVRALTGMIQLTQDPETMQVLTAAAMTNMEGEGLNDINLHFRRKLVTMGVVKPTEDEKKELEAAQQNQKPDAQAQYLMASAQQAQAGAELNQAKTRDTLAAADLKVAQTDKTVAETHGAHVTSAAKVHDALMKQIGQNNGGI